MGSSISKIFLAVLKGETHTDPIIYCSYPVHDESDAIASIVGGVSSNEDEDELVHNLLWSGCEVGENKLFEYRRKFYLSYIFEIEREGRNDKCSIAVSFYKNKKNTDRIFLEILKEIVEISRNHHILDLDVLKRNISNIYNGINSKKKQIVIEKVTYDLSMISTKIKSTVS